MFLQFLALLIFFRILRLIESSEEQHLFEIEIFCNIINVTLLSDSELSLGLDAERVIPSLVSGSLRASAAGSEAPAEPRVTELPALRKDVLQDPGASVTRGPDGFSLQAHHTLYYIMADFSKNSKLWSSLALAVLWSPF